MKVTFQIEGSAPVQIECNAGDNLLELARRANVAIDAPCSGNGSCGKCRVKLVEGEVESIPSRHITAEEYMPAGVCPATPKLWAIAPFSSLTLPAHTRAA